ncbi:MAG: hemerythrin domain-containing protein [Methylococcales bacterium]|nr:hemerythrin domain-containing protein [Methylococcales bacterium]
MKFQFTDPVTDFSNGLNVIKSYHDALLIRGENLLTLAEAIKEQPMNEALANRCIEMHCFYFHASRLHHLDEEEGLFPLLKNHSELFKGMMDLLVNDHEDIEYDWQLLAKMLGNPEQIKGNDTFQETVVEFEKKQRDHLTREDEDFLPKVAEVLSIDQLTQAGTVMAKLRHIS